MPAHFLSVDDAILLLLRRRPGAGAADLMRESQISQATLSRRLTGLGEQVLPLGQGRARRYFATRRLRSGQHRLAVYEVNQEGQAKSLVPITLLAPEGTHWSAPSGWPMDADAAKGVWPGLPYALQDMRPQGFLGRAFAQQWARELGVPANPREWHDDDVLYVLEQRGHDMPGNLIVGEPALQRWLNEQATAPRIWQTEEREQAYNDLAMAVVHQGAAGSSAGGEFPKFTTLRASASSQTPHVIVKFSSSDASGAAQRWRDLLVCEHLALVCLQEKGFPTARTQLLHASQRTFLEIERFDRHGLWGRSPLVSLQSINDAFFGKAQADWGAHAQTLLAQSWISQETARQMQWLWLFGCLIGNTDMHQGNLSFVPTTMLQIAPVYDMLPMLYAPLSSGEVPTPVFTPSPAPPGLQPIWREACEAACLYWQRCAQSPWVSASFATICMQNHQSLVERLERV